MTCLCTWLTKFISSIRSCTLWLTIIAFVLQSSMESLKDFTCIRKYVNKRNFQMIYCNFVGHVFIWMLDISCSWEWQGRRLWMLFILKEELFNSCNMIRSCFMEGCRMRFRFFFSSVSVSILISNCLNYGLILYLVSSLYSWVAQ